MLFFILFTLLNSSIKFVAMDSANDITKKLRRITPTEALKKGGISMWIGPVTAVARAKKCLAVSKRAVQLTSIKVSSRDASDFSTPAPGPFDFGELSPIPEEQPVRRKSERLSSGTVEQQNDLSLIIIDSVATCWILR